MFSLIANSFNNFLYIIFKDENTIKRLRAP